MWLGFSQKLGLKDMGFEAPVPQTYRRFVGKSFLGLLSLGRGMTMWVLVFLDVHH
jgi:hypothetical protein